MALGVSSNTESVLLGGCLEVPAVRAGDHLWADLDGLSQSSLHRSGGASVGGTLVVTEVHPTSHGWLARGDFIDPSGARYALTSWYETFPPIAVECT